MARQARAVRRGLADIMERMPVEQDSSAIWDDSVINFRAGNDFWVADNLAEWMSAYFGHDRIYLLNADNLPVRVVSDGELAGTELYNANTGPLRPLVDDLR